MHGACMQGVAWQVMQLRSGERLVRSGGAIRMKKGGVLGAIFPHHTRPKSETSYAARACSDSCQTKSNGVMARVAGSECCAEGWEAHVVWRTLVVMVELRVEECEQGE